MAIGKEHALAQRMMRSVRRRLRPFYHGYQKYFSEVGYFTRCLNYHLNYLRYYHEIQKRKSLAGKLQLSDEDKALVAALRESGGVKAGLHAFGTDETLLEGLKRKAEKFGRPDAETVKKLRGNVSKTYWMDLFHLGDPDFQPLVEFASHPRILSVVTAYLGQFPLLQDINYYYSPAQPSKEKAALIGSQGWHKDNEMRTRIKIFLSPFDMGMENGPTTYLPHPYSDSALYKNYPGYFDDDQARAFGIDLAKTHAMCAKKGELYFADTSRLFHYGARNQTQPRYLVIISYGILPSNLNVLKKTREMPLSRSLYKYYVDK